MGEKNTVKSGIPAQKIPYAELEKMAIQLSQQNKEMYSQLQSMENGLAIKRLEFLFKVVKYKEAFTSDFVTTCIQEIEASLSMPEETTSEEVVCCDHTSTDESYSEPDIA